MKIKTLILIFFLTTQLLQAQNSKRIVDSLLLALPKAKNDTIKARIYLNLLNNLKESDNKKALFYAEKGLQIIQKMNWDKGFAAYYNDLGNNYLDQSLHNQALQYYQNSLKYSNKYFIIREITYENIATIYIKELNFKFAKKYNNQAFLLAKKISSQSAIANCFLNFGLIAEGEKNVLKAKEFYLQSIVIFKSENNLPKMATALNHLGDISIDFQSKSTFFMQSKSLWDRVDPTYVLAISNLLSIAETNIDYLKANRYKIEKSKKNKLIAETQNYLNSAILYSKQGNIQQNLMYAYGKLSELKELQGDYKTALKYINMDFEIYEKVFSQENKNKIASLESKQKLTQKDKEIAIKKIIILQNEKQKAYLCFTILFFVIIGGLFYFQSNIRKKNNQKLQLLNTELDTANAIKIRFFSILNHDLKNPVSNLIDLIHIQQEEPELFDAESKKRIENKTLLSAENLLTSMEDILQWSKSQMGNFKPEPKKINVNLLLENIKKYFFSYEHIKITFENSENLEIVTDQNYLNTIIRNLTANAIKALNDIENPTILWKVFQEPSQNDGNIKTILTITDNGKGAFKEQFKALYDDNEVVGIKSGLGLHLIRDLAKAIDCKIEVESTIGVGTTFILKF